MAKSGQSGKKRQMKKRQTIQDTKKTATQKRKRIDIRKKKPGNIKNSKNETRPKFPKKTAGTKKTAKELPVLLRFFAMR